MTTFNQAMIWTVLPVGVTPVSSGGTTEYFLDFSVIVSPRLESDSTNDTTLDTYPDWSAFATNGRTWPDTIAALTGSFELRLNNVSAPHPYPARAVVTNETGVLFGSQSPQGDFWSALFPEGTKVTPYLLKGMAHRNIRSAPVSTLTDTINSLYGGYGYKSATQFPSYEDLVAADSFGPIGFNQNPGPDTGVAGISKYAYGYNRKALLLDLLESTLKRDRYVTQDLNQLASQLGNNEPAGAAKSLAFLQSEQFLQRPHPTAGSPVDTSNSGWDFHQIVGGVSSLPSLMRALGLVLDLRAGPISDTVLNNWITAETHNKTVTAQFAFDTGALIWPKLTGSNPNAMTQTVTPPTAVLYGKGGTFRAQVMDPSDTDLDGRMLKIGDTSLYQLIRIDHDNASMKAMQLGDNVTRSRVGNKPLTYSTPDNFALPALRTGGFAIARLGRAEQMAATLQRQSTDLQNQYFANPQATLPPLYAEDITKGYRFDVFCKDQTDTWLSLMWRQGTITVGDGDTQLTVTEEDTIVPSPTTAGIDDGSSDLYLSEVLAKWNGWSLAVPRIGTTAYYPNPPSTVPSPDGSSQYNVTTDWQVPRPAPSDTGPPTIDNTGKLPPLRFGELYQMRARAVDLAGNSVSPFDAPDAGVVVTAGEKHLRYEPIAAPRMLLLDKADPGASEEVMVVRSESGADQSSGGIDTGVETRMIVPGPSSVFMAEQFGAFDVVNGGNKTLDPTVYTDLANRDQTSLIDLGVLYDPSLVHSQNNPYIFPEFIPLNYLVDFIAESALVRDLPPNSASKSTTAELTFDPLSNGWPKLLGARLTLVKTKTNNWVVGTIDNQSDSTQAARTLELGLAVGDMITCRLNCSISAENLDKMALWEQIQLQAEKDGVAARVLKTVKKQILAGEHWMFTPWREITFVHAVRTPLADPMLYLVPTKTAIGQTYAEFPGSANHPNGGTVLFSRKSTARIDVNATWSMPIDTGAPNELVPNANDPFVIDYTDYAGHVFSLDIARDGGGTVPGDRSKALTSVDCENFDEIHQFNDTKYRAVTYQATATSYYIEYFRQELTLDTDSTTGDPIGDLKSQGQVMPGVPFEGSTVKLLLVGTDNTDPSDPKVMTRPLVEAPIGTDPDVSAPAPGDYIVVEDPTLASDPANATAGYIQLLSSSTIASTDVQGTPSVVFSYVGPTIHTYSDPGKDKTVKLHVYNSARPLAPSPLYVLPVANRGSVRGHSDEYAWTRNALRVYLNRPWWSSGDGERLGVVCWHQSSNNTTSVPPTELSPYVTQWGFDPIRQSQLTLTSKTKQPTVECFPLATASRGDGSLSIEELEGTNVDIAGHSVLYDEGRDLWFADIQVTSPEGDELESYMPFIRFAFARYQPYSLDGAHLSRVVTVDYAQIAPNRHLTVTSLARPSTPSEARSGYSITVAGYAPIHEVNKKSTGANRMRVTVETQDTRITDQNLAWKPLAINGNVQSIRLTSSIVDDDKVTWTGTIDPIDTGGAPTRLTIEEFELYGPSNNQTERLVFTDSVPITVMQS